MKANELRIGNLVIYEQTTHFITLVDRLGFIETRWLNQNIDESDYRCSIGAIKPIPITEEWLLKFGFKESDEGFMKIKTRKKSIYLEINLRDKRTILFSSNHYYNDIYHVKYIHQLQNLYFSLTQKELTL
jgi:hypothetical protein